MRQVLEALAYLQVRGLIHRDLKPENIMLANKSTSETSIEISVVDFGFMTKVSEHKILFSRCGTPGFVAPEVLADYDYDCKADIFSAGVIFYVLLLRHNPFQDRSYSKLVKKNKLGIVDLASIEELELEKKKQILEVLAGMLSKDPKNRLTASELLRFELFTPLASKLSTSTLETET